ncbi:short-chain fatty acid transporter [Bacillus chungangensis]|uniref:Short-chain fatty acids transporter n=1 Tax=Bacillus chungangensis TaxID=587633 RepID=A0ABT9WRU4_9BACI|nr:short-chain fatty acid transporter [Bacillus chungangensis]MDQ0175932.1 short-chain fatty acids transporter [Bacillus chungangensis]
MLKSLTLFFDRIVQRYLPDPYLFAIILTFIVFVAGIITTGSTPIEMVQFWGTGFWDLLSFTMQMTLVLVTGYVLASSPVFKSILISLAKIARTPGQAIILVTFISSIASWINWGFGLVIGALFAKQIARVIPKVDYRLLIASAYSGFLLWHGGLAGSVPLTVATPEHFMENMIGVIPTSQTIFAGFNLFIVVALLIILPLLNRLMSNYTEDHVYIDPTLLENSKEAQAATIEMNTPADRLENSKLISFIIGTMGIIFLLYYFIADGGSLNLNIVNFIFLFLGILFHVTPRRFLNSVQDAVKNAGGIIIQFPFYAGIMGMMVASGMAEKLSLFFVSISNEMTFPFLTFISAGIVNFFIPSGGGQFAIQGPIMLKASLELGVDTAKTAMAVAWGDSWTNMIQPFWALPALAIAGLRARDIMGFCTMVLIVSGIIISIGFLVF